ncbi:hypothetical protein U1Q18_009734, partial [Sarracenia purpurea var. burkii]
ARVSRSWTRTPTGINPERILKEAINLSQEFLRLPDVSDYKDKAVRSIAKSLQEEVICLRKDKIFDLKRLMALERRIKYLKGGSPDMMDSLSDDGSGKGFLEDTKPRGKVEEKQGFRVDLARSPNASHGEVMAQAGKVFLSSDLDRGTSDCDSGASKRSEVSVGGNEKEEEDEEDESSEGEENEAVNASGEVSIEIRTEDGVNGKQGSAPICRSTRVLAT